VDSSIGWAEADLGNSTYEKRNQNAVVLYCVNSEHHRSARGMLHEFNMVPKRLACHAATAVCLKPPANHPWAGRYSGTPKLRLHLPFSSPIQSPASDRAVFRLDDPHEPTAEISWFHSFDRELSERNREEGTPSTCVFARVGEMAKPGSAKPRAQAASNETEKNDH
jgi:hypothetical protein